MRKGSKRECVVCSTRKEMDGGRQTNDYCDTCPSKSRMYMGDRLSITKFKIYLLFTRRKYIHMFKINKIKNILKHV